MRLALKVEAQAQLSTAFRLWKKEAAPLPLLVVRTKADDYALYFPSPKKRSLVNKGFVNYATATKAMRLLGPLVDEEWNEGGAKSQVCVGRITLSDDAKTVWLDIEKGLLKGGRLRKTLQHFVKQRLLKGVTKFELLKEETSSADTAAPPSVGDELEALGIAAADLLNPARLVGRLSPDQLLSLLSLTETLAEMDPKPPLFEKLQAVYDYVDEEADPLDDLGLLSDQTQLLAAVYSPAQYLRAAPELVVPEALSLQLPKLSKAAILDRSTGLVYSAALSLYEAGEDEAARSELRRDAATLFEVADDIMAGLEARWRPGKMAARWHACIAEVLEQETDHV